MEGRTLWVLVLIGEGTGAKHGKWESSVLPPAPENPFTAGCDKTIALKNGTTQHKKKRKKTGNREK